MTGEDTDANQTTGTETSAVTQADATADSSTANTTTQPDANSTSDSSNAAAEQGAKKPASLAEVVKLAARANPEGQGQKAEGSKGEGKGQEGSPNSETAEPGAEAGAAKEKADEAAGASKPDEDVPFHKHPRWQQMLARDRELSQQVSTLQPKAAQVDEMIQMTGGEQGYANMRALVTAFVQEPDKAVGMLETLLADARQRGGLVLTSADLKEKVEQGDLDEAGALEIERARSMRNRTEQQRQAESQAREQEQTRQAVQAHQQATVGALNAWEKNISERDPDYAAIAEDVTDRLIRLATTAPPKDAEAAVALAQQAYNEVKGRWSKRLPAARPIRSTPSQASSRAAKPAPKNLREVIAQQLSGK